MALVPKSWYASPTPNAEQQYVSVVARESGLIAWLLALIKIDPTYRLTLSHTRLTYEASSMTGYRRVVVPVDSISSSYFGYHKPWKAALLIAIVGFSVGSAIIDHSGAVGASVIILSLLAALVYYFLNKELLIGIRDETGENYELVLKRSVLDNQEINEAQMELVTSIVTAVIDSHIEQTLPGAAS
jgi:hypothetical protein